MANTTAASTQKQRARLDELLSGRNVTRRVVPLSALKPHPRNYHLHPEDQIADLVVSYKTFGQFRSFVAIADPTEPGTFFNVTGHGTTEAMRRAGASEAFIDELPPNTPEPIVLAIMAADNEHGKNAEDDTTRLTAMLEELKNVGVQLEAMGHNETSLQKLLEEEANKLLADGDKMPDPGDAEVEELPEKYGIIIECEDEEQQLTLLQRFESENLRCRALVL